MMATLRKQNGSSLATRRRFVAYTVLRFAVGLAVGALIALGEHCLWLPCHLSSWISLSLPCGCSIVGPLLLQTLAAPALSLAGLHFISYPYTSRVIYTLFWVLHGVDLWNVLLVLARCGRYAWPFWILPIILMLAIGYIMLRLHSLATSGVADRSSFANGTPPTVYVARSIRLWGALLIFQLAFDLLYVFLLI